MELITNDGKFFISEQDYRVLHDLHKRIPDYLKTAEIAIRATDIQMDDLKARRNSLAKFRRELGEIAALYKTLGQKRGNADVGKDPA